MLKLLSIIMLLTMVVKVLLVWVSIVSEDHENETHIEVMSRFTTCSFVVICILMFLV